jgi:hypothetical protein
MKTSDKKYKVLVPRGLEPVTLLSHIKTLPIEARAQCDIQTVSIDKILTFEKVLKTEMARRPWLSSSSNQFCKTLPILLVSQ